MKDIFIDNNIAKNFATPLDVNYKNLISWLFKYDEADVAKNPENKANYAHLVVNQKLLVEYLRSSRDCSKPTAIPTIINKLTAQGRLVKIPTKDIESFIKTNFSKRILGNLLSNTEDHVHIPTVLLSIRKMALTYDSNLLKDLKAIPNFTVIVEARPENLGYENGL